MRTYSKSLAIIAFLVFTFIQNETHAASLEKRQKNVKYRITTDQKWSEVLESKPTDSLFNYTLDKDPSIHMACVFLDLDLQNEISKYPLEKVVKQVMKGKETIFSMVGAKVNVDKYNLESLKDTKILIIKSDYSVDKNKFSTVEKYFLLSGRTLLCSLRWSDASSNAQLKLVNKDFDTLELESGK